MIVVVGWPKLQGVVPPQAGGPGLYRKLAKDELVREQAEMGPAEWHSSLVLIQVLAQGPALISLRHG